MEELGDDHVVEGAEVDDTQDRATNEEAALAETTYVTDPVQDVVDLPLNDLEIKIDLEGHGDVHTVGELVRALGPLSHSKDSLRVFIKAAPVYPFIL